MRALSLGPFGNSAVARLGETWHGCDWSPFDGWEKRAPADDLSPSDPNR
jgi:hypothetical protein